jgi:hypothetical protein
MFVHLHHLGGVVEVDVPGGAGAGQGLAYTRGVPDEHDFVLRVLAREQHAPFNDGLGGVVTAHRIEDEPHGQRLSATTRSR